MNITRFFGKQSTPTASSSSISSSLGTKNTAITCVDMTRDGDGDGVGANSSSTGQSQPQSLSGSTPTINKVLFNTGTITSISAKKDSAQVKAVSMKDVQAHVQAGGSRPPPHTVVRIPPHTILIQPDTGPKECKQRQRAELTYHHCNNYQQTSSISLILFSCCSYD